MASGKIAIILSKESDAAPSQRPNSYRREMCSGLFQDKPFDFFAIHFADVKRAIFIDARTLRPKHCRGRLYRQRRREGQSTGLHRTPSAP